MNRKEDYKSISKDLISNETLETELLKLINLVDSNKNNMSEKFERNVIDPFAFILESAIFQKQTHEDWKSSELSRQIQKTFTNALGEFHQNILCSLDGCSRPDEGVDFICEEKKIVAEIKNKHNTINASSKAGVFDEIKIELSKSVRKDYKGYLVTIIPRNNKNYETQLMTTAKQGSTWYRKPDENIMTINGEKFFEKITGKKHMVKSLYNRIPGILLNIDKEKYKNVSAIKLDKHFNYYLLKAL